MSKIKKSMIYLIISTMGGINRIAYCRRRIKTEEKVKVVASVWGKEFIQFLAALAFLPWTILKNRINSPFSINHHKTQTNHHQTQATAFAFSSVFILLLFRIGCLEEERGGAPRQA